MSGLIDKAQTSGQRESDHYGVENNTCCHRTQDGRCGCDINCEAAYATVVCTLFKDDHASSSTAAQNEPGICSTVNVGGLAGCCSSTIAGVCKAACSSSQSEIDHDHNHDHDHDHDHDQDHDHDHDHNHDHDHDHARDNEHGSSCCDSSSDDGCNDCHDSHGPCEVPELKHDQSHEQDTTRLRNRFRHSRSFSRAKLSESTIKALEDQPHQLSDTHHHHFQARSASVPCEMHITSTAQTLAEKIGSCYCSFIQNLTSGISSLGSSTIVTCCSAGNSEDGIVLRTCCDVAHSSKVRKTNSERRSLRDHIDVEKHSTKNSTSFESVRRVSDVGEAAFARLSVAGMTCTGCENKLLRCLRSINGIYDTSDRTIQTNFILGRAEIWYDASLITDIQEQLCGIISRKTGFSCMIQSAKESRKPGEPFLDTLRLKILQQPSLASRESKTLYQQTLAEFPGVATFRKNVKQLTTSSKSTTPLSRVLSHGPNKLPARDIEMATGITHEVILEVDYDPVRCDARTIISQLKGMPTTRELDVLNPIDLEKESAAMEKEQLRKLLSVTILSAIFTIPVLVLSWAPIPGRDDKHLISFPTTSLVLASAVQLLAYNMYANSFRSLYYLHEIDMDCLVVLSTTTAYMYSVVLYALNIKTYRRGRIPSQESFFQTSCLLITLILAGRCMTGYIKQWATSRLNIGFKQEPTAIKSEETSFAGNKERTWKPVDTRILHYGDVLLASEGQKVATDGVILGGTASIDESHLTGEAIPVIRRKKDSVLAGSIVVNGQVQYRVTRLLSENTISAMKSLVTSAANAKPRLQEVADRVAGWLTPAILLIALCVFAIWTLIFRFGSQYGLAGGASAAKASTYLITILAISCPCAIGLAVPTVLLFSAVAGSKHGVVAKASFAFNDARNITHFVADKTGTLTTGQLEVVTARVFSDNGFSDNFDDCNGKGIASLINSIVQNDRHPVSKGVGLFLKPYIKKEVVDKPDNLTSVVGSGLEAVFPDYTIRVGKPSWCLEGFRQTRVHTQQIREIEEAACSAFFVVDRHSGRLLASFGLRDQIRPEARGVLSTLRSKSLEIHMLSGDNYAACQRVADELSIPLQNVHSSCSPEGKAEIVKRLQTSAAVGSRKFMDRFRRRQTSKQCVLFIGDGINDAIALTQADVGVSIGNSTDIAAGSADVGILSSSLDGILVLLRMSRKANILIWCNFVWALCYNFVAILLASGVGWRIQPQYAGLGEIVSVLPVFLVASIMLWKNE